MIYMVNMLLIFLYAWILKPDGKSICNRKLFCILVVMQLTCISGFQYAVGKDYFSYVNIYLNVQELQWGEYHNYRYFREPLFFLYTKIMSMLFKDNTIPYFCGLAFVCAYFFVKAVYDRKERIVWSVYIYLCMGLFYISMNQIRQMIAISIVLYAIRFIEKRKAGKYIFWILVASGVHNTALIMLPCYLVGNFDLKNRKKALGMFLMIYLFTFFTGNIILNILRNTSYGKLMTYQAGRPTDMIINLIYRSILLVCSFIYIKQVLKKNKRYKILYWIAMVGIIFQIISVNATSVARITTYFYSIFIFLIPIVLFSIPKKGVRKLAKCTVALGMMCYHLFYLYVNLGGMEYTSVFQMKLK